MVATNHKITKFYDLLAYFGTNNWGFKDDNVLDLWQQLSVEDKTIYPFDIAGMDWDQHAQNHILGLRVHVVKDPIESLTKARRRMLRYAFVLVSGFQTLIAFFQIEVTAPIPSIFPFRFVLLVCFPSFLDL